jgi:hypothetical protein
VPASLWLDPPYGLEIIRGRCEVNGMPVASRLNPAINSPR